MSRKIILIKQELLLLVYELNRSGLLAENEKIRPILAQLEKLLLCDLSPSTNDSVRSEERFSRNAETELVCRLLLEKKNLRVDRHDLLHCPEHSGDRRGVEPPRLSCNALAASIAQNSNFTFL